MCLSGYPTCTGLGRAVIAQTSGRGERGERAERSIMNRLCPASEKYLLGTSCAEKSSHLIPQTGKPLNVSLSGLLQQTAGSSPRLLQRLSLPVV